MKKRIILVTTIITILALIFSGCSAPKQASANQPENAAKPQNLLEQIKADGKIRFGTEGTYAPFTFHDKDGKLTGFDVEIAEEIAKRLGVKAEFIETKWDGIFAGLDAKRFDAIANEVAIREDRLQKYDFSSPYIVSKAVLIVNEENSEIKAFEDIKGKKAGQSLTSNLKDIAVSFGAEIVQTDGFNQAIDLLVSKRIDATINDGLSFLDFKKQRPDTPIKIVDQMDTKDEMGIMFNKGNKELVDAVNKALDDIKADGTYLKISEKWFGEDVSK